MALENSSSNWFFSSSFMEMPTQFVSEQQSLTPEPAYHHQHFQPPYSSQPMLWDFSSNEIYQSPGEDDVILGETTPSFFKEDSEPLSRIFQDENPCLNDIQLSAPSPAVGAARELHNSLPESSYIQLSAPSPAVGVTNGFHSSLPENSSGTLNTASVAFHPDTTQKGLRYTPPAQFTVVDLSVIMADHASPGRVRGNALDVVPSSEPFDRQPGSSVGSGQRKSKYRGVTMHKPYKGRYEAYLWDPTSIREGRARRGHQVYPGGYDKEEMAARAYDLAALKCWGSSATINFPELDEMENMSMEELISALKRKSKGFSNGKSMYRGVSRHNKEGQWQARIGRIAGKREMYLGTFNSEIEAAEAYDIAAIKIRGKNATTNFNVNRYDVDAINKTILPVGTNNDLLRRAFKDMAKLCCHSRRL